MSFQYTDNVENYPYILFGECGNHPIPRHLHLFNSAQFAFISVWPEILWNWPFDAIVFFLKIFPIIRTQCRQTGIGRALLARVWHLAGTPVFFLFSFCLTFRVSSESPTDKLRDPLLTFESVSPVMERRCGLNCWSFNNKTVAPRTRATLLPATHTCSAKPTSQRILKDWRKAQTTHCKV